MKFIKCFSKEDSEFLISKGFTMVNNIGDNYLFINNENITVEFSNLDIEYTDSIFL